MIIGRSPAPSGAIKIKKNEEGVPRVVSCGCCQSCACGSLSLSSLDPTFAKQLSGDDPAVAAFTQVYLSYEIEGYADVGWAGTFPPVSWVNGEDCGLKKYADFVIPPEDISNQDRYDSFVGCGTWARGAIGGGGETTFVVRLTKANCLEIGMYGNIWGGGVLIGKPSGACEEFVSFLTSRGDTITENYGGMTISGATAVDFPRFLFKGTNQYWPGLWFDVAFTY